jgi:hypothetical protein
LLFDTYIKMFKLIILFFLSFNVFATKESIRDFNSINSFTAIKPYNSQGIAQKQVCFMFEASPPADNTNCTGMATVGNPASTDTAVVISISGGANQTICCESL